MTKAFLSVILEKDLRSQGVLMQICTEGYTRVVFLTEKYAIKIINLRVVVGVLRFILCTILGQTKTTSTISKRPFREKVRIVWGCIHANYTEWYVYRKYKHPTLIPTIGTFFFIINVQRRGIELRNTVADLSLFEGASREIIDELTKIGHVCNFEGRITFCDYGHHDLIPFLKHNRHG